MIYGVEDGEMEDRKIVEIVAAAVCESFYESKWNGTSEFRKGICVDMAKAAIRAHLEAMIEMEIPIEGLNAYFFTLYEKSRIEHADIDKRITECLRAMIKVMTDKLDE